MYVRSRMKQHIAVYACLLAVILLFSACSNVAEAQEPEATSVPTPVPTEAVQSIAVAVEAVLTPSPTPPPTPTPSPTPTASPIPFSYYAPTVNMSYEELVGSTDDMDKSASDLLAQGYPNPETYYIIVDLTWQVVMVYKRTGGGTYGQPDLTQPVRYMICSSGNPDKEYGHETMTGTFQIKEAKVRFYQFVNLEAAQYLTLIRSRTYFHSILYDKVGRLDTLIKSSYDRLGQKDSHACIRLTVPDARWIFYNIGYGTTCEIRKGSLEDMDTASIAVQLKLPASKDKVKLVPSEYTWTDNWSIDDVAHELEYKYAKPPLPDLGDGDDEEDTGGSPATTDAPAATAPPADPPADPGTGGEGG